MSTPGIHSEAGEGKMPLGDRVPARYSEGEINTAQPGVSSPADPEENRA